MKYFLFFIIAFSVNFSIILAQNSTSRVIYHAQHTFPQSSVFNGKNTLHFNSKKSIFIHNNYPVDDNVKELSFYVTAVQVGDEEGFPVYLDLEKFSIYSKVKGAMGGFSLIILKEELDKIHWTITGEQKRIAKFNCLQATAPYEGREYEVWFAPDIPVPFGPYRLQGLPGLILEAKSLDNMVKWSFVGFEQITTEPIKLNHPVNGEILTWDEFVKAKRNYKIHKESKSSDEYSITIKDGNPEYYIEKGKFSVYEN